jgi:hypothetical protein
LQVGLTPHPSSRGICAVTVSEFLMDICVIEIDRAALLIQAENKIEIAQDRTPTDLAQVIKSYINEDVT